MLPDPPGPPLRSITPNRTRLVTREDIERLHNQQAPPSAARGVAPPSPPPPPPPGSPVVVGSSRWAIFNRSDRELTWIVVDRVTSIRIVAPVVGTYPAGYATAVWRVHVKMSHDEVVRDFYASDYVTQLDELGMYNCARDTAVAFARSITEQVDAIRR